MNVVLLTVFLSIVLAVFFVMMFVFDRGRERERGPEQDALLPFADEGSRPADRHPSSPSPQRPS